MVKYLLLLLFGYLSYKFFKKTTKSSNVNDSNIIDADYEEIEKDLRNLVNMKLLRAYPVLDELNGTPVSQAEHTLALTENGTIVLTE